MKREVCSECLNPIKTCYCSAIIKFDNSTHVYILRHPQEKKQGLATAQMAKLSFKNITILDGEDFSSNEIINTLSTMDTVLLYPKDDFLELSEVTKSKKILNVIVLDGTWKKTYKTYMLSKNLKRFQKVAFTAPFTSELSLRKPPKDSYLSTFESIAVTLEIIENKTFKSFNSPLKYLQDKIIKQKK